MASNKKAWGNGFVVSLVLLLVVALVAIVIAMGKATPASNPEATANPPATAAAPNPNTIKDLTVSAVTEKCAVNERGLVKFQVGVLSKERKWSDSVSTPFTATDPVKMTAELKAAICSDPYLAAMVANYFANLKLSGFEVASVNPWLKPFAGDGSKVINTMAASYIPLMNVSDPTDAQVADAVAKNKEFQGVAARLNTLLSKFFVYGVHSDPSVLNYHVLGGGLAADTLPAAGLNDKQESLPALQFVLTQKGQNECLLKIGFNTADKRLEQFSCVIPKVVPVIVPQGSTPVQPVTPVVPAVPVTPGNPVVPVTPVVPVVPVVPVTPPVTPAPKNPALDPNQNGNAGNGGGKNEDSGPGKYIPPAEMVKPPAAPRVNPPAPAAPVAPAPPKVVVPAPAPKPAPLPTVVPSAQPINNGVVEKDPPKEAPCNPDFQSCK